MFGVQLANVLVILRAKVKQGAEMLVFYRCGSCTHALMRFGAEVEVLMPISLVMAQLAPPPSFFMVVIQHQGNS